MATLAPATDLRSRESRSAYPRPAIGWLTVGVLFLLYVMSLTDRNIMALMIGPIKADLGLSDFQISMLQGPAFGLLYCICTIPVGLALDRYPRRTVLYFLVTLWCVGAAGCGLATAFAGLFLARAIVGAGEAGFGAGSYSLVGDSFPPARVSFAMSVFVMGGVMGAGLVYLVGGPIVSAALKHGPAVWPVVGLLQPWQQVFLVTGLPGLLLAFAVFLFPEPVRHKRAAGTSAGYGEAIAYVRANPLLFLSIFLGFGIAYAATIGVQIWTPTYLVRRHGWEPARIGLALGSVQIATAAMMPLHGWLTDRLFARGRRDAALFWAMCMTLCAIPFGVGAFLVSDPWLTIALVGGFLFCILATSSMGPALTQIVTPEAIRGRVTALSVMTTGAVAVIAGPSVVGLVTDHVLHDESRVGTSLIITCLVLLLPAAALFAAGRRPMRVKLVEGME